MFRTVIAEVSSTTRHDALRAFGPGANLPGAAPGDNLGLPLSAGPRIGHCRRRQIVLKPRRAAIIDYVGQYSGREHELEHSSVDRGVLEAATISGWPMPSPELTANALRDWCRFSRAGSAYIEPGSPWQNAYLESFGSRIRAELLAVELFSCLAEAQVLVGD